ncbi:hypothetical protein K3N28_15060 [Glycomyces sp. TRM65418]|uniref:hypothetical protein n=1 Tax=Glycomyces sp. TRM65418 TaxID=2867006 RepID=UPI001CE6150C|nr:hypothetical protein [Glycomyces sp. TRM65418]MCC3764384.1 hypothetical protein [Glycomyces sp. TRM65418]QZD54061.1 hypothetical protein K3N28_14985 [Glycomyces sp. TRM65418]
MSRVAVENFDAADESTDLSGHGGRDTVAIDGMPVERSRFDRGRRRSTDGTESRRAPRLGRCVEGHLLVHMEDGADKDINAGAAFETPPGHDAEVAGDREVVLVDFGKAFDNR